MLSLILSLILIIVAYLAGSVNSAIIVSRLFDLPDPRSEGSQNPGATNILRLGGKKYAIIVLIGDILKGLLPVLLAQLLNASPFVLSLTCMAAVLGHMYPIFFQFKGGKGVATAIGGFFGLNLILGVIVLALWLLIANFFRYSSLASIISISLAPFVAIVFLKTAAIFPPLLFIAVMVIYKHRHNVTRLIDGEESKISFHRRHQLSDIASDLVTEHPPTTPPEEPITTTEKPTIKTKEVKPKKKTKTVESKPKGD